MEVIKSKIYVSWGDIEELVKDLHAQISMSGIRIDSIYGMPRGGLIPAVMMSHKLGRPLITDGNKITEHTLVIDDICDTGFTFSNMVDSTPSSHYASLHYRKGCLFNHFCFHASIIDDEWIVYPWERADSDTIQDYLKF